MDEKYTADEKKWAELNNRFHSELHQLEQEIERLQDRHNVLYDLLFNGAGVEDEEEETVTQRRERYLLGFLKDNPGSSKSQIHEFFDDGTTIADLKRLLENLKRRGAIINEGRGRASVWYLTEEN